jgi:hypothetical protein
MNMTRYHVFSDEAGDFTFQPHGSQFFLIATITAEDASAGDDLQALQRELAWSGTVLPRFHATDDDWPVRNRVYDLLANANVRIDATALHKPKAQPQLSSNHLYFYKMANYLHFKYVIPNICGARDELMVVASSLQIKKKQNAVRDAVHDVVGQVSPTTRYVTAFLRNDTDPCLQLADYAAWAVQRWLEMGDKGPYDLIAQRVASVFQPWRGGKVVYYGPEKT